VDPVPGALAELLGHDGVRALGHGRARHDTKCLAGPDAALVDGAGGKIRHDAEARPASGDQIRPLDGVPVHGGVVGGGNVEGGAYVARQHATERSRDRKRLLRRRARHVGEDAGPGVRDGNHGRARYYTGRSAIVA
jgi:hypothetical protein